MKTVTEFICWGKRLNREAAIDSLRNVCAVIGVGTIIGDFSSMRFWMLAPAALLCTGIWYADYLRHF